jgi:hypothetical protein
MVQQSIINLNKPKESLCLLQRDPFVDATRPLEQLRSEPDSHPRNTEGTENLLDVAEKIRPKPPKHCMFSYSPKRAPLAEWIVQVTSLLVAQS